MKGTLFLKPLEFALDVQGEQWRQGDAIHGTLKVTNHGNETIGLQGVGVALATGEIKKLKNDSSIGLKDIGKPVGLPAQKLSAGSKCEIAWNFQLEKNCPIIDKKEALYLRFGLLAEGAQTKFLQLTTNPRPVIDNFLEIFVNFFRFKIKEKKNAKGKIEAILLPPQSREYSTIESLSCFMVEGDQELTVEYKFKVKSLEYSTDGVQEVKIEKKNKEVIQVFTRREYLIYGESANMDFFIKKIGESLETAKPKLLS